MMFHFIIFNSSPIDEMGQAILNFVQLNFEHIFVEKNGEHIDLKFSAICHNLQDKFLNQNEISYR